MAFFKATEWQDGSGRWHVANVDDLKNASNAWWHPMRMLGLDIESYILLLSRNYHASHFRYDPDTNVLLFSWDRYDDAHRYLLMLNRVARKRQYCLPSATG